MKRYFFLLILFASLPTICIGQVLINNIPEDHKNAFSLDANLAFGPSTTATWDPSLGLRLQVSDYLRIGIGDVSIGSADLASGSRYAIMGGPVVEFIIPRANNLSGSVL